MIFSHSGAPNISLNPILLESAVEEFERTGEITSMKAALVLHHVANYCVTNDIDFAMGYAAGVGFYLVKRDHDLAVNIHEIFRNRIAANKGDVHAVEKTDGDR